MQSKGTIIKKVAHTVMSDHKCKDCKEPIKQNLISKKPNAERCYKCHKASQSTGSLDTIYGYCPCCDRPESECNC